MPDMFDKLGDLLNEALESGTINQIKQDSSAQAENIQDRDTSSTNCDKSGLFSFKESENSQKNAKKRIKIPIFSRTITAEVIKMHKYTINMHIPPDIQQALTTLDIVYPYNLHQLNKQYRKQLKLHHPDKKNTIQNQEDVIKIRQLSIDDITGAYKLLKDYLDKIK